MMHGFQQIVTEAECRYNFVVHGLPPRGDAMAVAPLIWRKKLMDSIRGNLGYSYDITQSGHDPNLRAEYAHGLSTWAIGCISKRWPRPRREKFSRQPQRTPMSMISFGKWAS